MDLALTLILNILPLYALIGLGYIGGRWLDLHLQSMAKTLIFIVAPVVIFGAMLQIKFSADYLVIVGWMLACSLGLGFTMWRLAQRRWGDTTANLIGLGSISGNNGYFGLPLVLALYGSGWGAVYIFMGLAYTICENTLGYFMAVRGHHTVRESLGKVARLPGLHAMWLGLLAHGLGLHPPDTLQRYWTYATGTWVFIGMMLIGVALAKMPRLEVDVRLLAWLFPAKFILWPLAGLLLIGFDRSVLHSFPPEIYGLILIFTSVPLMANLVAYAAQLNLHPERAATAVLVSTLFAIVYMPGLFMLARGLGLIG